MSQLHITCKNGRERERKRKREISAGKHSEGATAVSAIGFREIQLNQTTDVHRGSSL